MKIKYKGQSQKNKEKNKERRLKLGRLLCSSSIGCAEIRNCFTSTHLLKSALVHARISSEVFQVVLQTFILISKMPIEEEKSKK